MSTSQPIESTESNTSDSPQSPWNGENGSIFAPPVAGKELPFIPPSASMGGRILPGKSWLDPLDLNSWLPRRLNSYERLGLVIPEGTITPMAENSQITFVNPDGSVELVVKNIASDFAWAEGKYSEDDIKRAEEQIGSLLNRLWNGEYASEIDPE